MSGQKYASTSALNQGGWWALCVTLLLAFPGAGCSGPESAGSPRIVVEPDQIAFGEVAIGDIAQRLLTIANEGTAELQINDLRAETNTGYVTLDRDGQLTIGPGDSVLITVSYIPELPEPTTGSIRMNTNDPQNQTVEVPLVLVPPAPRPSVFPPILDFGIVAERTETSQTVRIQNIGSGPLILCEGRLTGSADFQADFVSAFDAARGENPHPILLPQTAANPEVQSLPVAIRYLPPSPGSDETQIVLTYDTEGFVDRPCREGATAVATFPVRGEAGAPTLSVTPNPVNFGESPIDFNATRVVTIGNVGQLDLQIQSITLDRNRTSPDFTLANLPATPLTLTPESNTELTVNYRPREVATDAGVLQIRYTDATGESLLSEVVVAGIGSEDDCPIAVGRGLIRQDAQNRRGTEIDWALPLQTLVLDGTESLDPNGGRVADYSWDIIETPPGVVNGLRPFDLDPENPALRQYFLPVAGRYTFELRVYSQTGLESCAPARVQVVATPQEAIAVELTWDNPLDPDQSDAEGADMDLHIVKMPFSWFHPTFDTYYANPSPAWNPETPTLNIDDRDGAGPEIIEVGEPQNGACYAIGVHYFRAQFGTGFTRLRLYIDGTLFDEMYGQLDQTDDFWDAARIHWPSKTIYRIDEYLQDFNSDDDLTPQPTEEMLRNGHCASL